MTAVRFETSIAIGGTGMLAGATRWLAGHSASTLIISRRASHFAVDPGRIRALDADWDAPHFRARIEAALDGASPIGCALLWLHRADEQLPWLLPRLAGARIVLVLGSTDGNPALPDIDGIATVRLGSHAEGAHRRWLTHDEIAAGAIEALRDGRSRIVGDLVAPG